jgi:two-component system cell cycle response regulator
MMQAPHENTASAADPAALNLDELDLREAKVLIVDDNLQNLELLQAYLESLGCELLTARDGVEAAESIERTPPDIILLDVMMPNMSGFELCSKIKSDPKKRDIPIVMVTALNEIGDVERAVECGTDDFLTKPVNKLELLTRVRSLLRVRLLKKELAKTLSQLDQLRERSGGEEG